MAPSDLSAAGVDPATLDPHTFAMSSMGQPVAIKITGEADGRFDGADAITFFGQKFRGTEFQEKYTDERVYWLEVGGTAGPRIESIDATPQGDLTPPQDVAATVHAEQDTIWVPLWTLSLVNITQDTLFWKRLQPIGTQPVTATLDYAVPDPAPGAPATFRAMEFSTYSNTGAQPEHHNVVLLNNKLLLDQKWAGAGLHELTAAAPAGSLVSGMNSVQLGARVMPGNDGDNIYVNYWELDYRRLFRAWQGQFDFSRRGGGPARICRGWLDLESGHYLGCYRSQPAALADRNDGDGAQDLLAVDLLKRCSPDSQWHNADNGPSGAFSGG